MNRRKHSHPRGYFDSSKTRIVPLFNYICDKNVDARTQANRYLAFIRCIINKSVTYPNCASKDDLKSLYNFSSISQHIYYGKTGRSGPDGNVETGEKSDLHPQVSLLRWLIKQGGVDERIRVPTSNDGEDRVLLFSEKEMGYKRIEALKKLDKWAENKKSSPSKLWYILEGNTKPDAYIETDSYILLIEGKRSENTITTHTKWMLHDRDQIIRHIDSVTPVTPNTPSNKKVFALYIVPSKADASIVNGDIPFYDYFSSFRRYSQPEYWKRSLPHRIDDANLLMKSFIGAITWEDILAEKEFSGLIYPNHT